VLPPHRVLAPTVVFPGPVTEEAQALLLNAIPLLALSALYLAATLAMAPAFLRERAEMRQIDLAVALVYPALALAGAILGVVVLVTREPLGGNAWLSFAAILVGLVPALSVLAKGSERSLFLTGARRARDAETRTLAHERERAAVAGFTAELTRAEGVEAVARLLVEHGARVLEVQFAALTLVDEGRARGLLAQLDGTEVGWWRDLDLGLQEPSAISSVVFDAAPLAVYDVESSSVVNQEVAAAVGAKSGLWVPLVAGGRVFGVLALVATDARRAFTSEETALAQSLAAEAGLVLERARSGSALADALAREQLVARIAHRVRSEFDLAAVLATAVEETGTSTGVSRCIVRLGPPGGPLPVEAEWTAVGVLPIADRTEPLPPSNLATRTRRTVAVADVETAAELADPALGNVQSLLEVGSRAVLATPIVLFDEVIGAFVLDRAEARPWAPREIALAEAIAHEVGLAIHIARLLAENRSRVERQAALLEAAQVLASELDFDLVIERLVESVVGLLQADAADCWILDEDERLLRCRAVYGLPPEEVGRELLPAPSLRAAIGAGRPLLGRDVADAEETVSQSYREFGEIMDAPIAAGGRVRGVLGVCSRERGRFGDEALEVLETFAGLASLALRNAEAFEERALQARVQRGFYRIAAALGESLSLEQTLEAVAQAARDALGGVHAVMLMPEDGGPAAVVAHDLPGGLDRALEPAAIRDEAVFRTALEAGKLVASVDVASDERFGEGWRRIAKEAGCRGLLAVPVERAQGVGGLVLVFFEEARRFTDDDVELAEHLARAAAGALERSRLFEEERSARALAQQLARTGSLLATELDPSAVLEEVVRQAPRLVGADAALIRVLEDDELVVSAAEGVDEETLLGERSPGTAWLSGDVVQSRSPLAVADAAADERLAAVDPLLRNGHRAYLGVPLSGAEGTLHGVLSVYSRAARTWRDGEIEALQALAGNASAALSNAELYQRVALEKERSDAILANIADGIVAVDREGCVVLWNSAAEQITGVPAEEALGRTPLQVLGRELEPAGAQPGGNRLVSVLRGREEVWLSLTEAVMRDPAGLVAGRIYAFRDISSDRFVEQMKSDFVSTVSQELRRPLTSIYGFAETLLRQDIHFEEEERRTFLGYIASESEHLAEIVDALLNVARLEAGDLQVNLAPLDVRTVVAEAVEALEGAGRNGHRFVLDLPDEPVAAAADREKLRQVLSNLLDNAVKFSPSGATVTVAARRRRDVVEVSVADEGVGIPRTEHRRIFRKFYRGDAGGARSTAGTGLGLFIAEGLVTAMGGRIWVSSAEGEGASFTFELPLAATGDA
jgi:PAS domain S-box-containing protein